MIHKYEVISGCGYDKTDNENDNENRLSNMTIDSIDIVLYTIQFLLPGYIISRIISILMPQKNFSEGELTLRALGYSILNLALWCWAFIWTQGLFQNCAVFKFFLNVILIIVTSFITGLIIGLLRKFEVLRKISGKFGLITEHSIPTAWDYKFSDGKSYWVEITISSGAVIRGLYSEKSLSSSLPEYRDVFIEEAYIKSEDEWKKVDRTAGVWVNPDEIRYIKFYEYREKNNG